MLIEESESRGIPAAGQSAKSFTADESKLTAIADVVKLIEYEKLLIFTLTAPTLFTNCTKQHPWSSIQENILHFFVPICGLRHFGKPYMPRNHYDKPEKHVHLKIHSFIYTHTYPPSYTRCGLFGGAEKRWFDPRSDPFMNERSGSRLGWAQRDTGEDAPKPCKDPESRQLFPHTDLQGQWAAKPLQCDDTMTPKHQSQQCVPPLNWKTYRQ